MYKRQRSIARPIPWAEKHNKPVSPLRLLYMIYLLNISWFWRFLYVGFEFDNYY